MQNEWRQGDYILSTDRSRLDLNVIHGFLTRSYWSPGIPRETVERAIQNSMPFGLYLGVAQIGLARVITDFTSFGYLADVFILEEHRGQGLSKWMMETLFSHPELQGFRRWMLATRDAHGLYRQVGFTPLAAPERFMEKWDPDIYRRGRS
ncbi:GNAT family N-acetyltransferase [Archangium sp.]|uniref:GNAT family N-acetyltransferase n=1 Tax=Archangium sp. TaxID=1872627 RepID=UPI00389A2599